MAGILEVKSIGNGPFDTLDPFLFCVYHKDAYPAAHDNSMEAPKRGNGHDFNPNAPYRMYHGTNGIPGFPQHPHRGFETVTATIDGLIDHSDSMGNAGRYGNGDVQWMTAGKGVVHAEMFPLLHKNKPNNTRFFQIWLNLPAKDKMTNPSFAMFWANEVPRWKTTDGLCGATVWYGNYFLDGKRKNPNKPPSASWASVESNDVAIIHLIIQAGGTLIVPKAHESNAKYGVNRALYLVEGFDGVTVNSKVFKKSVMITVDASQSLEIKLSSRAKHRSELLLLQGKAIKEHVVRYGPFVMNTNAEIQKAFSDYRKTRFGGWPWQRDDMVWQREKGRFALLYGETTVPDDGSRDKKGNKEDVFVSGYLKGIAVNELLLPITMKVYTELVQIIGAYCQ